MKIMSQLAQVPRLFNLPIAISVIDRLKADEELKGRNPEMTEDDRRKHVHMFAMVRAAQCVQHWMEKNASDEVAMLIAEDTPAIKSAARIIHEGYTDPELSYTGAFHAPNIVDAIHFAKKDASLLLQIADHAAFIVRRKAHGRGDANELFSAIHPHLYDKFSPANGLALRVKAKDLVMKN